jgi:hypothetical protein
MLSARQLAQRLGCSRSMVRKAISDGLLKARKVHPTLWAIEVDQHDLALFCAKLKHLKEVRRSRAERMRSLWQTGKLRPRRRKVQVQVIERWKRPSVVVVGEGIMQRSHPITWREGEGVASCPVCGSSLKVQ